MASYRVTAYLKVAHRLAGVRARAGLERPFVPSFGRLRVDGKRSARLPPPWPSTWIRDTGMNTRRRGRGLERE